MKRLVLLMLASMLAFDAGAHGTGHVAEPQVAHVAEPQVAHVAEPQVERITAGEAPLFEPPKVGSYELPPIERVREHVLLGTEGLPQQFPGLGSGQIAVVSFVYSGCGQACPAALATLQGLDRTVGAEAQLSGKVRLVTVSFDPRQDTPERMAELRRHLAPQSDWSFVTAPDEAALDPVLDDYGQHVMRLLDPSGAETGVLRHVLKVFLVDESLQIRNVYSAGLMDARLILNDIQTVLAE